MDAFYEYDIFPSVPWNTRMLKPSPPPALPSSKGKTVALSILGPAHTEKSRMLLSSSAATLQELFASCVRVSADLQNDYILDIIYSFQQLYNVFNHPLFKENQKIKV